MSSLVRKPEVNTKSRINVARKSGPLRNCANNRINFGEIFFGESYKLAILLDSTWVHRFSKDRATA